MKKKLNTVYFLFVTLLLAYFQLSNSGNPNNGHTGAPPTGNTCANGQGGCHSGPAGLGTVSIDGLPSSVSQGQTYPITVTIERTATSRELGGFQLVAQLANNSNAGLLDNAGPSSTVQFAGGKYYFEHSPAASFNGDIITYTADWTAPSSGSGTITLYACAVLADNNGGNSGDCTVTTTATTTLTSGGGGAITVVVTGDDPNCYGGSTGSATATASGGGGAPYNYAWSNGGSGATITNLPAGNYTVTVTNSGGGNGTGSVSLGQPPALTLAIVDQENITCTNPVGSATVSANGGTGAHTYAWSNGQSGPTATLNAGSYTASVTDGNGCVATTNVTITSSINPPAAEAGPTATLTCATPLATLNGAGSATGSSIQYLWTTADGNIVSGATTLNPVVNESGTYTLTVTNTTNGCTNTDLTVVGSNIALPTSSAGADGVLTCTNPTTQLNGTGSSSGASYTYLWTTSNGNIVSGANAAIVTVDAPGTYCLTVTNTANGCSATDCASVTSNTTPPIANAGSASPLTCTTSQVTLNGGSSSTGSNFSYLWTTTTGNIVSGATTLSPVVNVAAVYVLTVTNATNGCTASSSVTVTSNTTQPTASAGPDKALNCNNSSVVLDGSGSSQGGNFTYLWSGPGIVSGGSTPTPTVNTAGGYIILVTNTSNGCTKTDTASVAQTPALVASIPASQNVLCNGANTGSATAAGSGGKAPYSYAWSNNANTAQITGLAAGTYTVIITDADNCTASATATVTQPTAIVVNASATGETSVGGNNGTATANPSGGVPNYTYSWSNGATTQSISNLAPGTYTVSITDANNCVATQTVTVASFSCGGVAVSMASTNPSCNGGTNGTAVATPNGGNPPYSYAWSNGATTSSISGLAAGSYTVSMSDGNGCVVTGNVTLTSPSAISLSSQVFNVSCNGGNNGSAFIAATGGTGDFTYNWSNGGTGATQANLSAGSYTASATDANGCVSTIQVAISQPPVLVGVITASNETAVNANDGTAAVAMSGGLSPYTYVWNHNATTPSVTGLAPGTYCVTVTDAASCTFTGCATVAAFGCVGQAVNTTVENVSCAGANDGSAIVTASGFTAPVSYNWSNGSTGSSIGNLSAGTYTVSVSGADGCAGSQTITITQPAPLTVSIAAQNDLACANGNDGSITVTANGGTPNYDYAWSNGATTPTVTGLGAGTYSVVVSDDNDCTTTLEVTLNVLPDVEAPVAKAKDITVTLPVSGPVTITSQQIDDGSTDNCGIVLRQLSATTFGCGNVGENPVTLTVTDAAGNTSSATAIVTVLDETAPSIFCPPNQTVDNGSCAPTVNYSSPNANDNCGSPSLSLVSGPASGTTFPSGISTVVWSADDGNGNTATCSFTVTVISSFNVSTSATMPACNGGNDGTATATGQGGTEPYSFQWDDPAQQTTATATGLAAGTYQVSVTDATGCVAVQTVQLAEPPAIVIVVDLIEPSSDIPGAIYVTVSGGTGSYTYNWFNNGQLVSEEEDPTDLFMGEYQLVVTDDMGCTTKIDIILPGGVSTKETELERLVTIAPNPSSGRTFLTIDLGQKAELSYQVFDLAGNVVLSERRSTVVAKQNFELHLEGAAGGVYLVRVIVDNAVVTKRLILGR
ncbi:MAG: HYR domain-containing protein [Saprospiraceae bacterium]|nr:HYR domain-containing protein [Saprospiraceae bacterium]